MARSLESMSVPLNTFQLTSQHHHGLPVSILLSHQRISAVVCRVKNKRLALRQGQVRRSEDPGV